MHLALTAKKPLTEKKNLLCLIGQAMLLFHFVQIVSPVWAEYTHRVFNYSVLGEEWCLRAEVGFDCMYFMH